MESVPVDIAKDCATRTGLFHQGRLALSHLSHHSGPPGHFIGGLMTRIHSPRQACRPAARAASACAQFANPGRPSPCSFTPAQRVTLVEALESRVLLAVITVTTTADDGPGSLR
jgi:hypothetical protein